MQRPEHVRVSSGWLLGRRSGGLVEFRGVRYAAPPINELRFAPPAPVQDWDGTYDASRDGPISPQHPSRLLASMGEIDAPQSEDCLTLTIWTPARRDAPSPVLVWLHGGGFATGAGSLPWYDGGELALRHGLVVVGVNYRLGALGYLSVPDKLPGNLAILDQECALHWVHDNIAAFGGDPRNVTVMGESGGGHTIASLLTMARTEGIFQRAILQSPPLGIGLFTSTDAARTSHAFLDLLDLSGDGPELLTKLRKIPVERLLTAQSEAARRLGAIGAGDLRPIFMPTEAEPHKVSSEDFINAAAESAACRGIDILIGWTREEANLFYVDNPVIASMTDKDLAAAARNMLGHKADALLAQGRTRRPQASAGQRFKDLVGDVSFRLPALKMAESVTRAGGRAFVYQFDWQSPDSELGACHCLELPFVFGTWRAWASSKMLRGASEDKFSALSGDVMRRWANFAAHGEPGFPHWGVERPILHIDLETRIEHG